MNNSATTTATTACMTLLVNMKDRDRLKRNKQKNPAPQEKIKNKNNKQTSSRLLKFENPSCPLIKKNHKSEIATQWQMKER